MEVILQKIPLTSLQTETTDYEIALREEILKEENLKKEIESLKNNRVSDVRIFIYFLIQV
jgi:hypothetical protein